MIKLILFDLGGVVFTNGTKKFIRIISDRYRKTVEEVSGVIDGEIGTLYREAKIDRDEFWRRVIDRLGLTQTADELELEWISGYELIRGTKEIIDKLKSNYQVWYLSDNVKERVDGLEKAFGFLNWFDGGLFSHEVGARKPSPEIYKMVLEKTGVEAGEIIFIDDKESSLIPAEELGMHTLLFESPEKLTSDLSRVL